ncbi:MAG TPA: DUF4097 family beta strand repeat-containing protein [Blastocatellia bacterium]|nr:DUF4097 family beta strand repeat-containing protein [Blastocatellia bacterium]
MRGTLLLGLLLVGVGVAIFFSPPESGLTVWLTRLWPVFMICAGVVRVMGYAVERKPRSPMGGMLLIIIGVLFFVSRFHSDLNALEIYGRYWILLLAVYAGVELIRYYSHRHTEGPTPRVLTPARVIIVTLIVGTGVLANRLANNPSVLSALKLPRFLSGLRDSVVGQEYAFSDGPVESRDFRQGMKVTVKNSFGSVNVAGGGPALRATLNKRVRGWNDADARKIADQIQLIVTKTSDGISITTNREQVNQEFTTDIQIEVPSFADLSITDSYGAVSASNIQGDITVRASHGQADLSNINGDVNLELIYSDASASTINGNLTISGAKRARVSKISGSLDLSASNGVVEARDVSGPTHVNAPFSKIVAQGLNSDAELKTEHASVEVSRTANLIINAPHSDVQARNVNGDLRVSSSNGNINIASIAGEIEVQAEQSSVSIEDARGYVDVETTLGNVVVKNFYEGAHVETSYRDVTLITASQPADNIDVENKHGEIKLVLPQSSQFQLDALSENGQVKPVGFSELAARTRGSLIASLGSDGPSIKLRTSYKNIIIQASPARQTQANSFVN